MPPRVKSPTGVEDGWVTVGALMGAHGVKGDVRVRSFTDDPKALFTYTDLVSGDEKLPVSLTFKGDVKDGYIARIKGVAGREAAQALKGTTLYRARDSFEAVDDEDDFYLVDLIGLEARDSDGQKHGRVRSVENFGAEDLLELVLDTPIKGLGRHIFIPFRRRFVPVVDIQAGFVTVDMAAWSADQLGGDSVETGVDGRDSAKDSSAEGRDD